MDSPVFARILRNWIAVVRTHASLCRVPGSPCAHNLNAASQRCHTPSQVPDRTVTQVYVSYQAQGVAAAHPPLPPSASALVPAGASFEPASGALYNETMFMLRTGSPVLTGADDEVVWHTAWARPRGQRAPHPHCRPASPCAASQATNQSTELFWIRMPAFADASSANEAWGWPANLSAQACVDGSAPCFNATTGRKWWGFISLAMDRQMLGEALAIQRIRWVCRGTCGTTQRQGHVVSAARGKDHRARWRPDCSTCAALASRPGSMATATL